MSNKQKLELTWIQLDDRPRQTPLIRVEFLDDPLQVDSPLRCREAMLAVCNNPRCDCSNVQFQWLPPKPDSPGHSSPLPQDFWFSINENSIQLTPELEKDPESFRLGDILSAELTEELRLQMREWFLSTTVAVIQATPIDEFDISGLPDATDGQMIGFVDIFPCGLALNFTWNSEFWAVDEQYCVQSRCTCKETILSFLKLMDAEGNKATSIRGAPALRYNYATHATNTMARGPSGSPPLRGLLEELKRQHPDMDVQLELRHLILQSLYRRQERERIDVRLAAIAATNLPRTGRNDPCPCGSGRKYKHCCLKKPRT
jgi:hypothetical protein